MIKTAVRGLGYVAYAAGFDTGLLTTNARGELLATLSGLRRTEATRQGESWVKLTDAVASIATAIPTTTAAHTLWNGNVNTGRSVIIDKLTWMNITSAGAATAFGMVCCLHPTPVYAQPATADTLTAVSSKNGKTYGGLVTTSKTVTVPDNGWWVAPIPTFTTGAGTVTGSLVLTAEFDGDVIVPPGCRFSVSVCTVGTTVTGNLCFHFREHLIDNQTS
jgi:hypothetical protein